MAPSCCCNPNEPFTRVILSLQAFGFFFAGLCGLGLVSCTFTTVQETFHLSYTDMSIVLGAGQITQVLASLFAAKLERPWLSAEAICGIGALIGMSGKIMYGAAQHLSMLIIGQLLAGLGNSFSFIYMPSMLSRLTDDPTRISDGIGKATLASPLGLVGGVAVCAVGHHHWRWLFIGFGSLTLIPAFMFFRIAWGYRKNDPRREVPPPPTVASVFKRLCAEPHIVLTIFGLTCCAFVAAGWAAYIGPYMERHLHQSKMTAAFVLAGTVPVIAAGVLVGGKVAHAKKLPPQRLLILIGVASLVTFLDTLIVLPGDVTTLWIFIIVLVVAMFFLFMQTGPGIGVVAMMLPEHMICHGQSIVNGTTRTIGSTLAPLALGLMLDHGISMNMGFFFVSCVLPVACIFYFISALLIARVRRRNKRAARSAAEPGEISVTPGNASLTPSAAALYNVGDDTSAAVTPSEGQSMLNYSVDSGSTQASPMTPLPTCAFDESFQTPTAPTAPVSSEARVQSSSSGGDDEELPEVARFKRNHTQTGFELSVIPPPHHPETRRQSVVGPHNDSVVVNVEPAVGGERRESKGRAYSPASSVNSSTPFPEER